MLTDRLTILIHYLIPQQLLSRLVGLLAHSKRPGIKNRFIQFFLKKYPINMSEALQSDPFAYPTFSDFFTRQLKPGARPIDLNDTHIVSPADGVISELGKIEDQRLLQAKGREFNLSDLLAGQNKLTDEFQNGTFATVYLAPKDYHRVHMPLTGKLREMIYVPGQLFSVNFKSAQHVPNLFARNERLIAVFDTVAGPMALILVGAMIVANIHTVWGGQITPGAPRKISKVTYNNITLSKGDEMGLFTLGSTVIVLFSEKKMHWLEQLGAHSPVKVGECIGKLS